MSVRDAGRPVDELPGDVAVSVAERWLPYSDTRSIRFGLAIPAAAIMHILAVLVLLPMQGAPIGDEPGVPVSVSVELLDAKEFDRRSQPMLDPGKNQIEARAEKAPSMAQPEQPQEPAKDKPTPAKEQQQQQKTEADKFAGMEAKSLVEALSTPLASDFQVPRQASGKQSLDLSIKLPPVGTTTKGARGAERQVSAAETYLERRSRGQRSAAGIVDEFTRTILRILQQSRPISHGATGRVIVGFGVTESGFMEGLHLVESSGQPKLDKMVMDALRQVELVTPPAGATLRDRTFEVTYVYDRTSGRVGF